MPGTILKTSMDPGNSPFWPKSVHFFYNNTLMTVPRNGIFGVHNQST